MKEDLVMSECYNGTEILTCKEVMQKLRISRSLFYRYIKEGKIKGYREGNKIKVPCSSVESYITARMKEGA
jgi:excisionase family DNA binding protein